MVALCLFSHVKCIDKYIQVHRLHRLFSQSHNAIRFAGSFHKNNTSYLFLGLYHASVNWISIVLMQITPQNELYYGNGPFPSCCLSRFRSESRCSTIEREMSLICRRIRNSFPFEWLCTRTRFETEASSNSEMGYFENSDGSRLQNDRETLFI